MRTLRWIACLLLLPALPAPAHAQDAASLTAGFESNLATQEWTLIKTGALPTWTPPGQETGFPLRLVLLDAEGGQAAPMEPSAHFIAGDRLRWGGRALAVDWVLVLEGAQTSNLAVHLQFKSAAPRLLSVEATLALPLEGWLWHDGLRAVRPIERMQEPYRTTESCAFGSLGEQALHPLGVISSTNRALAVEEDSGEPRCFQPFADPEREAFGLRYDFALDLRTRQFPGRAAFRLVFQQAVGGSPDAFQQACRAYLDRRPALPRDLVLLDYSGPEPIERPLPIPLPPFRPDEEAIVHTGIPLLYESGPGSVGALSAQPAEPLPERPEGR